MMSHPNYDQYWKEHDALPNLKNIKTSHNDSLAAGHDDAKTCTAR